MFLLIILVLSACSSSSPKAAGDSKAASTVEMKLIKFKPEVLRVKAGTTVKWVQNDAGFHSVVSGMIVDKPGGVSQVPDGKFISKGVSTGSNNCKCDLKTGATFSFTFDQPGTYPYYCSIHPATMRGEVRVS